jgi:hypothetical protein
MHDTTARGATSATHGLLERPDAPQLLAKEAEGASVEGLMLLASIARSMNVRTLAEEFAQERDVLVAMAVRGLPATEPVSAARVEHVSAVTDLAHAALAFQNAVVRYEQTAGAL